MTIDLGRLDRFLMRLILLLKRLRKRIYRGTSFCSPTMTLGISSMTAFLKFMVAEVEWNNTRRTCGYSYLSDSGRAHRIAAPVKGVFLFSGVLI